MGQGAQKHISNHVIPCHPSCLNHHISNGPRCEMGETEKLDQLVLLQGPLGIAQKQLRQKWKRTLSHTKPTITACLCGWYTKK